MSRPFKQREVACARCFRLKRKCDHAKPTCGECRRKGADCLPARSRRTGDDITVSLAYLKGLERRLAELETLPIAKNQDEAPKVEMCDAGVQTDGCEWETSRVTTPSTDLWMPWATSGQISPTRKTDSRQEDTALMLLSGSKSWDSPQPSFMDAFFQLKDENLDFLHLDKLPSSPPLGDHSEWLLELYTNIYFSISHREWPFLNEAAWKRWRSEESLTGQEEWRQFFLRMVYAIGASLCSTMQRDPVHSSRSKEMYASAMSYYPHVVGHQSMVLKVQASLLLVVYALHCPSAEEIATSVSSIVPFCTAAMTEIRKFARTGSAGEVTAASGEILTENMFIACFMLNVIIASGWDRPVSPAYRAVDDDVSSLDIPYCSKLINFRCAFWETPLSPPSVQTLP